MATRLAILATAKAILRLLADACPQDEFPKSDFRIFQAGDMFLANTLPEGISIYLYHVTANSSRRNMPPRVLPNGKKSRPSLPVDLHFMLTPWSSSADTQLSLLGWAMRTLDDSPIIPASYLNYDFSGKEVFHADETVELVFNPLSMQDMAPLWEDFRQARIMPSVTYIARLVALESNQEVPESALVQTRMLNMAGIDQQSTPDQMAEKLVLP